VIVREFPILSPESVDAARMALAAAQQGKFARFHDAMYRLGPPSAATIEAAAREAGVDLAAARAAMDAGVFDPHLQANAMLAQQLGISGTPGWVVGDQALNGAVGRDRENPMAWYQLGMVYAARGDIPRARLASAEQQIMSGSPRAALQNAEAAEHSLPQGSADWIRAQDISLQARAELERARNRN
jgi:predicted Zn-dependent protease